MNDDIKRNAAIQAVDNGFMVAANETGPGNRRVSDRQLVFSSVEEMLSWISSYFRNDW